MDVRNQWRITVTGIVGAISATMALWVWADKIYTSNSPYLGYGIGLFGAALPAIVGFVLYRCFHASSINDEANNLQRVVQWFLGIGIAFFLGMVMFPFL